jgi:hypothetical protein
VAAELAGVRFTGQRDGRRVDTWGLTVIPVPAWHFLRGPRGSLAFEFGLGGAWFARPFPPGGTHLNGASVVGLGARVATGPRFGLRLGGRLLHHSNGQGFVEDNPAFDGLVADAGVTFRIRR